MDGAHATDRIQIQNIEGFNRSPTPQWIIRKNPANSAIIEIINTNTGLVQFSGSELYTLFNSLTASSDFLDGHNILIKPDATTYNAGESNALFTKTVYIFGYGATIRGGTTEHANGGALKQNGDGKSISVFGLTIDGSQDGTSATKRLGNLLTAGGTTTPLTCPRFIVRDCVFKNVLNYGINVQAPNNGTGAQPVDSMVIIDNCRFDNGGVDTINEHILTNAVKFVNISNCQFYGNKTGYVSAQTVLFSNCYMDATGVSEGGAMGIHARDADVYNVTAIGQGLTLRPFTAVHFGTNYEPGRRHSVRSFTTKRLTLSYNAIEINTLDSTYKMGEVNLEDIWVSNGTVATVTLGPGDVTHGLVDALTIRNAYIEAFDSNNAIITVLNHDIGYLTISNVKTPAYPATNTPIRFTAALSTCNLDYLSMNEIYPLTDGNIVTQSISSTFNNTITATAPLANGQNGVRVLGTGTGTRTLRFLSNRGKATLSGTGSATTFNIAHNLLSVPAYAQVTPGSSAARGDYHVTSDATNIIVTYATAPASGTNNVVLYWSASAS